MDHQVQLIQQQVPNQNYLQYTNQAPILMQGNIATLPNSNQIKLITGNPMITGGQTRK